jgi:nucleoside-diphosphate-sugar epimerase|tara:strand:+ start:2988 stop:3857 length:870 start_codon:yes stop_codon:yes gene_type:complete
MKLKNFMKKKIKIFITGGSGYIGSHIINSFHKHTNIKIYNFDKRVNHEIKNKNCKNIKGNIKNLMKYKNIIKKCNYFFHLAASKRNYKSLTKPYEYFNNNIMNNLKVLELLKENKTMRLIFFSTEEVNKISKEYVTPYALSKFAMEELLKTQAYLLNLKILAIRLPTIYSLVPDDRNLFTILKKKISKNRKIILDNPNAYLNFLEINILIKRLKNFISKKTKPKFILWKFISRNKMTYSEFIKRLKIKMKSNSKIIITKKTKHLYKKPLILNRKIFTENDVFNKISSHK